MMKDVKYIKEKFEGAFDVKFRQITTCLGDCTLVFIDDLCSAGFVSEYVVASLQNQYNDFKNVDDFLYKALDINLAGFVKDIDDAIDHVLSADVAIIFHDYEKMLYAETKGFTRRGVSIPVTEAVVKGPREGFTELLVDNVSLIRRKVKNADLKFESVVVGKKSNTAVCISYIKGVVPKYLVDNVKEKINGMDLNFLLDTNYIEAELREKNTVFDTVGYTEKPDEIAAKLFEGRVAVLVDGTPFVITVPYFFLENFQAPDDYYLNRYFVNFTRVIRWIAFFIATFVPGLYVAIITHHFSLIPSMFVFRLAVSRTGVPLPTIVEVLLMMLSFQIIKEAGVRLPQPIGGAMSIVAGLILGDAVVSAGIASRITVIIVAASTLSYFLTPKLYGGISIWSIIIAVVSALHGLPGFLIISMILLVRLAELNTGGYAYLFPIGSTSTYKFKDVAFRGRLDKISKKIIEEGGQNNHEEKNS